VPVSTLVADLLARADDLEGVTMSGGEPFQQIEGMLAFLDEIRTRTRLSVIILSGYALREIASMPGGRQALGYIDVLIAGRYVAQRRRPFGLRGSSNKQVHLLTDRYRIEDFDSTPPAEVLVTATGDIIVSGIVPPTVREMIDTTHAAQRTHPRP